MTDYLDDKDRRIVAILQKDGRASVADMAKELNLTRATISKRMDRLIETGIISGFTAVLRKDAFKGKITGWVTIRSFATKEEPAIRKMKLIPEISKIFTTNGKWDLAAEIQSEDLESFDRALSRLRAIDGIEETETSLLLSSRVGQ